MRASAVAPLRCAKLGEWGVAGANLLVLLAWDITVVRVQRRKKVDPRRWRLLLPIAAVVIGILTDESPRGRFLRSMVRASPRLVGITVFGFVVDRVLDRYNPIERDRHRTVAAAGPGARDDSE